ncbi:MAG: PhoH family protein [Clostridia bacterium]|nr:PhoH family protein [Clostridia bacterium]
MAIVEDAFMTSVILGDGIITVEGDNEAAVRHSINVIRNVAEAAKAGEIVTRQLAAYYCDMESVGRAPAPGTILTDCVCLNAKGTPIKPKTAGQKAYVDAIVSNTVTFGIGPAGTGKTFLAVAEAVSELRKNQVSRIILTRPAVEAGEKLGFLPGDLQNKVDPYLRPLYDALFDIMGFDSFQKKLEKGIIEIAPLAYMRGRTLDSAFIILDEAQNTTREQLKMFLTRIGNGSRAVVNGDVTQIDLPRDTASGLKSAKNILDGIEGIAFVNFTERDVVRHELVKKIIKAYEKYEEKEIKNDC